MSAHITEYTTKTNGQALRELRTELKLTLREMSELTGISTSHLNQIELGRANLNIETAQDIENRIKTKKSSFLWEDLYPAYFVASELEVLHDNFGREE